jgi:hypothetical protein
MAEVKSRRSFLVDALTKLAGGVLLVAGLPAVLSGCVAKYGGPPFPIGDGGSEDDAGATDADGSSPVDASAGDTGPIAKYGGPPADAGDGDVGPVPRYGGPPSDGGWA